MCAHLETNPSVTLATCWISTAVLFSFCHSHFPRWLPGSVCTGTVLTNAAGTNDSQCFTHRVQLLQNDNVQNDHLYADLLVLCCWVTGVGRGNDKLARSFHWTTEGKRSWSRRRRSVRWHKEGVCWWCWSGCVRGRNKRLLQFIWQSECCCCVMYTCNCICFPYSQWTLYLTVVMLLATFVLFYD